LPVLNSGREILFLVAGAEKADALGRVFAEGVDRSRAALPAARVQPTNGRIQWFVDRAAAPTSLTLEAPARST